MIQHGEVYTIETIDDFQEQTGVTVDCLRKQLPDGTQDQMVNCENTTRQNTGEDPIQDAANAHTELKWEFIHEADEYDLIVSTLQERSDEYVHLFDGTVHTIVRLHPLTETHRQSHGHRDSSTDTDSQ
ncbi:hypothetical protein [environmental halophage 1 AAJ-2005]|nr:hypothetical protein [environmental halophage 1 AAJ-2005]